MKRYGFFSTGCVILTGLLLCVICQADNISTNMGAGADTHIYYFSSDSNYGSETGLNISKNYVPYLKFDLSTIGQDTVTDATLTLYGTPDPINTPTYNKNFNVYGLVDGSDDWGEMMLTYANAPLVTNPIFEVLLSTNQAPPHVKC